MPEAQLDGQPIQQPERRTAELRGFLLVLLLLCVLSYAVAGYCFPNPAAWIFIAIGSCFLFLGGAVFGRLIEPTDCPQEATQTEAVEPS